MKRNYIILFIAVMAAALCSCNKESLKRTVASTDWSGEHTHTWVWQVDDTTAYDMERKVAMTVDFGDEYCRLSGSTQDYRNGSTFGSRSTWEYYGHYVYEKGSGAINTDALQPAAGTVLTFEVPNDTTLKLQLPANFLLPVASEITLLQESNKTF